MIKHLESDLPNPAPDCSLGTDVYENLTYYDTLPFSRAFLT